MPKFTFNLDGVLRHRKRLEQQAQRQLAEKMLTVTELQNQLKQLNDELARSAENLRRSHLTGQIDLTYLSAHRRFATDVNRRGTLLMQKLAIAQWVADGARASLAEAARQHKMLETLRERHHEQWTAEQARRELAEADDTATRLTFAAFSEESRREEASLTDAAGENAR